VPVHCSSRQRTVQFGAPILQGLGSPIRPWAPFKGRVQSAECRMRETAPSRISDFGFSPACSPMKWRSAQPQRLQVQVLPRGPIWNVNRTSESRCIGMLTSACLWASGASPRHSASARSSKRTVCLISRVALDQCRAPERYRTRAPFLPLNAK